MKTCTTCGESQPRSEFHKDKSKSDGLRFKCKKCVSVEGRTWRGRNLDRHRRVARDYYKANRDRELIRMVEYHNKNPHMWWEKQYLARAAKFGFEPVVESFTKDELIARWGPDCWHCKTGPFEHLDHFPVPMVRGGHHSIENCRPSCAECNYRSWREGEAFGGR